MNPSSSPHLNYAFASAGNHYYHSNNVSTSRSASAPAGQSVLHNILLNSSTRRSISDSAFTRYYNASPSATYYDNKNTQFMMINRSGGSTVKKIIPIILERCDAAYAAQQQQVLNDNCCSDNSSMDVDCFTATVASTVQPPEEECFLLAQWAVDSYYKVVIAGNGGIPALIRAMQVFPGNLGLQECCCTALGNLCEQSESNQIAVGAEGGIRHIVAAMKMHSQSVAVQSAACEALRNMSSCIDQQVKQSTGMTCELIDVLQHAKEMYLHPSHRRTAEHLLSVTVMNSIEATR